MTTAWFDCTAGASGDMLLGALLDAGASLDGVRAAVRAVAGDQVSIDVRRVQRRGLAAAKADVIAQAPSDPRVQRSWRDVRTMLENAALHDDIRGSAVAVFTALAEAEGRVHGLAADDVHLHEVGALDSIADIVGVSAALHDLAVTSISCSPVALGSGSVQSAHGRLPVPVPAVVQLMIGRPVTAGTDAVELCTPTAAAILATLADRWGALPAMTLVATGTGAGDRDLPHTANVVRLLLGDPGAAVSTAPLTVLEATVDDLDPRIWPTVVSALLDAGAADVWLTPVLMKKGRPGQVLTVLAPAGTASVIEAMVFHETSTLGLRRHQVDRIELDRHVVQVEFEGHGIGIKVGVLAGTVVNVQPEFEDVRAAAAATGLPLKEVMTRARMLYETR